MSILIKSSLIAMIGIAFVTDEAAAQYYNPAPGPQSYGHHPGGLGLDLGLRNNGFNPNAGFGIGQVGAGVGTGIGKNGLGVGANTGVGPIGASADVGLGRNGLGARASSGIGKSTGAAFEGGVSNSGVGIGANAKILNFGAGASVGIGKRGPGLGASLGFGPLGTLLIGSHRNSYPGAKQTAAHMYPNQTASYYTPQHYGNSAYYQTAPVQRLNHPSNVIVQPPHYVRAPAYRQTVPQRQYMAPACPVNWTC